MLAELLMNEIWYVPDVQHLIRVGVRLGTAVILGGIVGFEREIEHKFAGVRTHMLVALGAALFTLVPLEAGLKLGDLSRVLQGLVTGIGFLGAGCIFRGDEDKPVRGLTSAASVWLTAGLGMSVGAGLLIPALLGVTFAWIILAVVHLIERWAKRWHKSHLPASPFPGAGRAEEGHSPRPDEGGITRRT